MDGASPKTATKARHILGIEQLLAIKPGVLPESPQWSPDGSAILFVSAMAGEPDLWTVSPSGGTPTRLTAGMGEIPFLGARLPQWSPAGESIAYVSAKSGTPEIWLWNGRGPDSRLTRLGAAIEAFRWSPDGRSIVLAGNRYGQYDIYRVAVPSGDAERLTRDTRYDVYPAFMPDGAHILYVRLNETWTDHDVILMDLSGRDARVVVRDTNMFDYHFGRTFGTPQPSPDGTRLLIRSQRSGWFNYYVVPIDGGDVRPVAPAEADQSEGVWSPDGRSVAYVQNRDGTLQIRTAPAAGGEPRVLVGPDDGACAFPQWSPDGRHISYLFQSTTAPQDLWVVDVDGGRARALTSSVPEWAASSLVRPEKVHYQTDDGLTISAYLYRGRAADGEKSPGILWIHGGPTSQFLDTFQPSVQFFAMQGYTLLLPNIRGSSGYGRVFEDLNNRDWGGGDLRDAIAGKRFLATLPDVDADHTGITGTSYGGCLTMSAVCYAPEEFQAAVVCSGYANWVRHYREVELRHIKLLEYEFGGPLAGNEEVYYRCSPIYKTAQATTPCFVLHGEGKWPWTDAGLEFARALERGYKIFQYKVYPNENYYVLSTPNVRQMLLDMLEWFDLFLRNRGRSDGATGGLRARGWTGPVSRDVAE